MTIFIQIIKLSILVLSVAVLPVFSVVAQESGSDTFDGEWRYQVSCASCHGKNGEGINAFGPPLAGNAFVKSAPVSSIVSVIQKGRFNRNKAYPDYAGMPAFHYLRGGEVEALVEYLKAGLQR